MLSLIYWHAWVIMLIVLDHVLARSIISIGLIIYFFNDLNLTFPSYLNSSYAIKIEQRRRQNFFFQSSFYSKVNIIFPLSTRPSSGGLSSPAHCQCEVAVARHNMVLSCSVSREINQNNLDNVSCYYISSRLVFTLLGQI